MTNATEIWVPVPGHNKYEVSTLGRVRSWKPRSPTAKRPKYPKILRQWKFGRYLGVVLCNGPGKQFTYYVHRLVLLVFYGPCPEGMEALHGLGGRYDNSIDNLSWGLHAKSAGQDKGRDGIGNCLTEEEVQEVRKMLKTHTQATVSRLLDVDEDTVSGISRGIRYTTVPHKRD